MKKIFIITIVAIVVVSVFVQASRPIFDQSIAGQTVNIDFEKVNVRSTPKLGDENIIDEIERGQCVTLTGLRKEVLGGDGSAPDSWVEIKFSNGETDTAWIVSEAVDWLGSGF